MRLCYRMVVILPLLLAACTSGPAVPDASSGPDAALAAESAHDVPPLSGNPVVLEVVGALSTDDDVVCRRENVTGTHQKREICTTRAARREEQRDAQEWMRSGGLRGGATRVPAVR